MFLFSFHSIPSQGNCTFLKTYFKTLFERTEIIFICVGFSRDLILLMKVRCSGVLHKQLICSSYVNMYEILRICF